MSENPGGKASQHRPEVVGGSTGSDAETEHRDVARGGNATHEVRLPAGEWPTPQRDTQATSREGSNRS